MYCRSRDRSGCPDSCREIPLLARCPSLAFRIGLAPCECESVGRAQFRDRPTAETGFISGRLLGSPGRNNPLPRNGAAPLLRRSSGHRGDGSRSERSHPPCGHSLGHKSCKGIQHYESACATSARLNASCSLRIVVRATFCNALQASSGNCKSAIRQFDSDRRLSNPSNQTYRIHGAGFVAFRRAYQRQGR